MSETASFVDPVFLARFGLSRLNVLDYFLHPLNPFRTSVNTSNEVLAMQGTGIGTLMQFGIQGGFGAGGVALGPKEAEDEYNTALSRLTGEQYELLPPPLPEPGYTQPSPLYTIRHIHRSNPTTTKILGIYYVLEGVIYKSPSLRSLMKANVARTLEGLSDACVALSRCAQYQPSTGYFWMFQQQGDQDSDDDESDNDDDDDEDKDEDEKGIANDPVKVLELVKSRKRRKILDNRRPGERTDAEEEGIRASEAIDRILVRLAKNPTVTGETMYKLQQQRKRKRNLPSDEKTGAGSAKQGESK